MRLKSLFLSALVSLGVSSTAGAAVATHVLTDGSVTAVKLADHLRQGKYFYERFSGQPATFAFSAGGVAAFPSAAQAQIDYLYTAGNNYIEMYQTTAQTLMPLAHATSGLSIGLDLVDNEAVEYVPGGNRTTSPYAFVVGTSPDFFIRATFNFTAATGSDQFCMGFRKQEAYAVPVSILTTGDGIYTDFFCVGFADATGTDVFTASDLNNGGSTTATDTGFNAASGVPVKFEVRVVGRRVRVYINGVQLGGTVKLDGVGADITDQPTLVAANFSFDTGDTVIPWIFARQDAATGTIFMRDLEIGPVSAISTAAR